MDSDQRWQRPLAYDGRSVIAEASTDSTNHQLVSAIPMDDLSTLGNDTISGGGRNGRKVHDGTIMREDRFPGVHNLTSRVAQRGNVTPTDQMVYLSPESLFNDDLVDGDDTTLTDDQQETATTRRIYTSAYLYGPLLVGMILGLAWSLTPSRDGPTSMSRSPTNELPVPAGSDMKATIFPTIVSFDSPIAPPNNRPSTAIESSSAPNGQPVRQPTGVPSETNGQPVRQPVSSEEGIPPSGGEPTTFLTPIEFPTTRPNTFMTKRPSPPYTTFQPEMEPDREYFSVPVAALDARGFLEAPSPAPIRRAPIPPVEEPSERLTAPPWPDQTRHPNIESPTIAPTRPPTSSEIHFPTTFDAPQNTPVLTPYDVPSSTPSFGYTREAFTEVPPPPSWIPIDEPPTSKPSLEPHTESSPIPATNVPTAEHKIPTPKPSLMPSPGPTVKPEVSTQQQSLKPSPNPTTKPIEPTRGPSVKPSPNPTAKPVEPIPEPVEPTPEPVELTPEAVEHTPEPVEPTPKPTLKPSPEPTAKPIELDAQHPFTDPPENR